MFSFCDVDLGLLGVALLLVICLYVYVDGCLCLIGIGYCLFGFICGC